MDAVTWFASLKAKLIALAAVVGAILLAVWRIFAAGKNAARREQMEDRLDAVKQKHETEDRINAMDDDTVDRELDKWLRDKR